MFSSSTPVGGRRRSTAVFNAQLSSTVSSLEPAAGDHQPVGPRSRSTVSERARSRGRSAHREILSASLVSSQESHNRDPEAPSTSAAGRHSSEASAHPVAPASLEYSLVADSAASGSGTAPQPPITEMLSQAESKRKRSSAGSPVGDEQRNPNRLTDSANADDHDLASDDEATSQLDVGRKGIRMNSYGQLRDTVASPAQPLHSETRVHGTPTRGGSQSRSQASPRRARNAASHYPALSPASTIQLSPAVALTTARRHVQVTPLSTPDSLLSRHGGDIEIGVPSPIKPTAEPSNPESLRRNDSLSMSGDDELSAYEDEFHLRNVRSNRPGGNALGAAAPHAGLASASAAEDAQSIVAALEQSQGDPEHNAGSTGPVVTSGDRPGHTTTKLAVPRLPAKKQQQHHSPSSGGLRASESDDAHAQPVPGRYGIKLAQLLKRAYASLNGVVGAAAFIAIAFAVLSMLYPDKLIQLKNPAQTEARDFHLLSARVASLKDAHDLLKAHVKQTHEAFEDELRAMNDTLSRVQSQSEILSKMMGTTVEENGQLKQSFEHLNEQVQERCTSDERGALSGVATQQVSDMIKQAMKEQMGGSPGASGEMQTAASMDVSAVFETVKSSLVEELQADIYKNSNGNGSLSHDDGMRTVLQNAVQREVAIAQDGVAMSDVALASAGARVIKKWTGKSFIKTTNPIKKWYATRHPFRPPEYAMDIDRTAGHCWAFKGNRTTLGIQFGGPVFITHISLDHAPRSVWPSVAIAPKDFEVWGILNDDTDRPYWNLVRQSEEQRLAVLKYGDDRGKMVYLTNGTYTPADDYFGATQTWPIVASAKELNLAYEMILLKITSTHGAENGCLYRFRVHGGLKYREGFNRTSIV
ncbi:hypothetical protein E5Q_05421 [Mixia osmundae IAM 14324]|uniref:SUN domain-containing protein n=1 Tax=Mixia osmundae (strain CBS 9802 / IAM 14324 / JCM 22182 / KY 12970) TaxID=764103 RepID=G7E7C3_MIXOS|nr:hypothetical protein E5Q_05421 [Mixia osmundae IAM 14324]